MLTDFEYDQLIEMLFLEEMDFYEVQEALALSDEQMEDAFARMEQDGYIETYTVH